jgi:WD40 repeat protein
MWQPISTAPFGSNLELSVRDVPYSLAFPCRRVLHGWVNAETMTPVRLQHDPVVGTNAGAETARLERHSGRIVALCVLPDGRLASGSWDNTIRLWDPNSGAETAHLETDARINCLTALPAAHLIAGDTLGRLHWLEVVDRKLFA